MKHPFCVIGVLAASAVLSVASRAQPPEQVTVPATNPPQAIAHLDEEEQMLNWARGERPEQVAFYFLSVFYGQDIKSAAFLVAGADWRSKDIDDLLEVVRQIESFKWRVRYNPEHTVTFAANDEPMTVKVRVGAEDELMTSVWQEEEITLQAATVKDRKIWRIVPEKPETIFTEKTVDSPDVGVVRRLATYLAFPEQARLWLSRRQSMSQVKQIGLGLMQYLQDWDEKYPPDVVTFFEKIKPYIRKDAIFTAPGERENPQSYNLNPNLVGKNMASIKLPLKTVAVYLGRDGKLDFRYDGQTVVGFADGHVETLDAEQAKALIWEP